MAKKKKPYRPAEFGLPASFREHVVVEMRYEAPVAAVEGKFIGIDGGKANADELNSVLEEFSPRDVRQNFAVKKKALQECLRVAVALPKEPLAATVSRRMTAEKAESSHGDFFKSNFVRMTPRNKADTPRLIDRLKRHAAVWDAYRAPVPVPPLFMRPPDVPQPGLFNLEPTQGYLYSPPTGIGAADVWNVAGGAGAGVTICDVEGGWNLSHSDLPTVKLIGGSPLTDPEWVNHGTAVLGEMVSVANPFGTVGICHDARAVAQSAFMDNTFNASAAIDNAASKLHAGDVMLVELHSELHAGTGDYVAMQYFSVVFTAIQAAVDKGIVVVEAAGNGNQDFDAAKYKDTGLQKDCGAIVVGAGVPPTNYMDFNGFGSGFPGYSYLGVPRSRIFFSNYGKIVNVQGWGWHVSTTGYGDAADNTPNDAYTIRFSGTSSASPIVTGAVACLQGVALKRKGRPLTPAEIRQILVRTGTSQEDGPRVPAATNHIGPQPNLQAAIKDL